MAHNINYNNKTGKHSFFSVKEKAWHNLGQIIEHYPTSGEAIVYAGLNFEVEKRPLFTYNSENFAVRTDSDEVLGVVGRDYNVVQNVEAFGFFDSIVGGGSGIKYETAGCFGRGQVIFITA